MERKAIFAGLGAVVLVSFFVWGVAFSGRCLLAQVEKPFYGTVKENIFVVDKGESAKTIARHLKERQFISHEFLFVFYVWDRGLSPRLQAGKYLVRRGMSVKDIADMIVQGKTQEEYTEVTIPEGFTLAEIEQRTERELSDFTAGDFRKEYLFLTDAPQGVSLEGYLFPDTYRFALNAASGDIANKMLANFDGKVSSEVRAEIARQGKSMFETVTMASLIEREVRSEDDMRMVSGVLWKRLEIGIPLQVDATVVYAVGHSELTYDDLAVDHPYNTYRYRGLPPGPIANPGLQAILAAVYPAASDYLYYLSKSDGETIFSKTLREHNIAKEKYLK